MSRADQRPQARLSRTRKLTPGMNRAGGDPSAKRKAPGTWGTLASYDQIWIPDVRQSWGIAAGEI